LHLGGLTTPAKLLILASAFRAGETLPIGTFFPDPEKTDPAMKKLVTLVLPATFAALSFSASAGVAPSAPNSALVRSGAKIAPPAMQSAEDKENKREHQENTPKDSAK
jgi:hypothetical protein